MTKVMSVHSSVQRKGGSEARLMDKEWIVVENRHRENTGIRCGQKGGADIKEGPPSLERARRTEIQRKTTSAPAVNQHIKRREPAT